MNLGLFVRSAFAVAAGYIMFAIPTAALFGLTGHEPHAPASVGFMIGSTVFGMVLAAMAGYLVALISFPGKKAPVVLAVLMLLGALIAIPLLKAGESAWSSVAGAVFVAPAAILGGLLRQRHKTVI
jgi:hypothetical protein